MANVGSAELVITLPGDTLVRDGPMRVPIVLRLATPRRVRSIFACFRGAEETKATYTTTHTNAKGQVTTQIHTAVEHVDIVQREWLLAGRERRGCFGNLADALATLFGGGRHHRMTPGDYRADHVSDGQDQEPVFVSSRFSCPARRIRGWTAYLRIGNHHPSRLGAPASVAGAPGGGAVFGKEPDHATSRATNALSHWFLGPHACGVLRREREVRHVLEPPCHHRGRLRGHLVARPIRG